MSGSFAALLLQPTLRNTPDGDAAFGRDAAGAKRMEFTVTTIEGSMRANAAPLPEMGKLS